MQDTYQVVANPSIGDYKEKGSKFIALLYPVRSVKEVEKKIEEVKSLHPKARHHCYAYRIGIEGKLYRANDDGEPSGTAGKPILGQLHSTGVSDTLIVVVRYFGGTKLGVPGLIHAYKSASADALSKTTFVTRVLTDAFELRFEYAKMGHVMNVIKSMGLMIKEKSFDISPRVVIELPRSMKEEMLKHLKAKLLGVSSEQISEKTEIPYCTIVMKSGGDIDE